LLVDRKLDSDDPPRPEADLSDFVLSREVVRLMQELDERITTTIELIDIRAGIPRRVVFRAAVEENFTSPLVAGSNCLLRGRAGKPSPDPANG
jgi:hypothetical protein